MSLENIVAAIVLLVILLVWGLIWGSITDAVMSGKGYSESWFWKGFFGGMYAYRDALRQPLADHGDTPYPDEDDTPNMFLKGDLVDPEKEPDAWQCRRCCKWNHKYSANCSCGNSKSNNLKMIRKVEAQIQELEEKDAIEKSAETKK